MDKDFGVLVLISGRGSNFKTLRDSAKNYSIIGVLSDKPEAPGLAYGQQADIPCHPFSRKDYKSRKDFKSAIFEKCRQLKPDLIVLAGFMQVIQPDFVEAFYGRIVNIHPSLLPKYRGLDAHARALEAGETTHGCSVHYVDSGVDTGPIIAQASCSCLPHDTEQDLAARVLTYEHQLYPWVVNTVARGEIKLQDRKVCFGSQALAEAQELGFIVKGDLLNAA